MVRHIVILTFICLSFVCKGQNRDIEFEATFSRDSIFVNDSLEIVLCYKNNSNNILKIYPITLISMLHSQDPLDTPFYSQDIDRMLYILNNNFDYDSIVFLKPQEKFIQKFDIKATNKFFHKEENEIFVSYHVVARLRYTTPNGVKIRENRKTGRENLILRSPAIKINVYSRQDE